METNKKTATKAAEVKTTTAKAEEVKTAPKATVKVNPAKAAVKTEAKAAEKKETAAKKETVKKETAKKAAPAKKETAKKAAPAKKEEDVKVTLSVQFAGKSYSTEDLVKIAKDVWQYDLKQKVADFKSVDLYVKPEEGMVYYVVNGKEAGGFYI